MYCARVPVGKVPKKTWGGAYLGAVRPMFLPLLFPVCYCYCLSWELFY